MHVVGHKAVASDTDIEKVRELPELLQKQLIMPVREENPLPHIATTGDMITRACKFDPQWSCH
jgi:hypothetical protein